MLKIIVSVKKICWIKKCQFDKKLTSLRFQFTMTPNFEQSLLKIDKKPIMRDIEAFLNLLDNHLSNILDQIIRQTDE